MAKAWHDFNADPVCREPQVFAREKRGNRVVDWRKRISDHIAYALLVYTGLQIAITIAALRQQSSSLLPYLALVLLVVAVIPACRHMEQRWTRLSDVEAADPARAPSFRRDRAIVWAGAIGVPFLLGGFFRLLALLFS
jgi:hypothetical protein